MLGVGKGLGIGVARAELGEDVTEGAAVGPAPVSDAVALERSVLAGAAQPTTRLTASRHPLNVRHIASPPLRIAKDQADRCIRWLAARRWNA